MKRLAGALAWGALLLLLPSRAGAAANAVAADAGLAARMGIAAGLRAASGSMFGGMSFSSASDDFMGFTRRFAGLDLSPISPLADLEIDHKAILRELDALGMLATAAKSLTELGIELSAELPQRVRDAIAGASSDASGRAVTPPPAPNRRIDRLSGDPDELIRRGPLPGTGVQGAAASADVPRLQRQLSLRGPGEGGADPFFDQSRPGQPARF
jgi:hypothetical protein